MGAIRRIFGVLVMIAGIVGLVLSLAGLVGLWMVRPMLTTTIDSTVKTLNDTVGVSLEVMQITDEALGATVNSVDALSEMLAATSTSVQETQPVVSEVNEMMGKTLPETVDAASASLTSASQAASSLESTIQSLDTFRMVMSGTPFLSAFVPSDAAPYNPDESMADSLNRLAISIENMPKQFEEMAAGMDKADDNLALIQANLDTMSSSVALISSSLGQYRDMISRSESSMTSLQSILTTVQNNSSRIITGATIALALFLFWLLAAQIVIFSQGLELYRGTAGHMEGGPETPVVESAAAA